jgi:hypothetical protein
MARHRDPWQRRRSVAAFAQPFAEGFMKRKENERRGTAALALVALLGVACAIGTGCAGGSSGPSPTNLSASTPSPSALTITAKTTVAQATLTRDDWRRTLTKTPVPKDGCFHAKRPSTTWEELPCAANHRPLPLELPRPPGSTTARGQAGGGGVQAGGLSFNDFAPYLQSGSFSWAEGSFASVSGLESESDSALGANVFSLQLNSNVNVPAKVCSQAVNPADCSGWEQFVYVTSGDEAEIFIEYWILNFGKTCPNPWGTAVITNKQTGVSETDCVQNSLNTQTLPATVITDLPNLSLTGISGTSDTLVFSSGDDVVALSQSEATNGIELSGNWQLAEFNVFGFGNGSVANFNCVPTPPQTSCTPSTNANINVQILVDSVTPTALGPSITEESTTGESNNMYFEGLNTTCSLGGEIPGIQFFETTNTNPVTPPACPATVKPSAPQLLWYQNTSGDVIYWESDTTGNVYGANYILGDCGTSGNCSSTWQPAGTIANQLYWYDPTNPYVAPWVWVPGDAGVGEVSLGTFSTPCAESTGCFTGPTWTAIGPALEAGANYYIFFNASTGQFYAWLMPNSELAPLLDDTCKGSSCPWKPVLTADINNDGNTDIVFQSTSGQPAIMVWTLNYQNRTFELTGTQSFSEALPAPNVIGAADVNGDGHTDITFWNPTSGQIISWLLNSSGTILGTQTLNATYAYSTSNPWAPIGYMSMP